MPRRNRICLVTEPSAMPAIDHPQRYATVNELHARPFPVARGALDCRLSSRSRSRSMPPTATVIAMPRIWLALLDRHSAPHPQPGATHYSGPIGRAELKWESHTEFVTYSAFQPGYRHAALRPGGGRDFPRRLAGRGTGQAVDGGPDPDRADAPGPRRRCWPILRPGSSPKAWRQPGWSMARPWWPGDFRIDPAGFMRFAVFVRPGTGARRVGRIVQRLCEIETYRAMSMLGLMRVA
jgi:hypothetical protein